MLVRQRKIGNGQGAARRRRIAVPLMALGLLVAAALACNFPGGQARTETPTPTEEAAEAGEPEAPPAEDAPAGDEPAGGEQSGQQSGAQGGQAAQSQAQVPTVRTTTTINVRGGAGTDCPIIGTLAGGVEIEVKAISPGRDWWQIPRGAGVGWISASFTTPVNDVSGVPTLAPPPCPTVTPTATLTPTATDTPEPTDTPLPPTLTFTPTGPTPTGGVMIVTLNVCVINPSLCPTPTPTLIFINPGLIVTLGP